MSAQPSPARVRTPPFTPRQRVTSDPNRQSAIDMADESQVWLDFVAVGAPTLPGFLLTVPGLALFLAPVIAIAVAAAAAGLVLVLATVPVVLAFLIARVAVHRLASLHLPRSLAHPRRPRPASPKFTPPVAH